MRELQSPIRELLQPGQDSARIESIHARIVAGRLNANARARRKIGILVAAAIAAGVILSLSVRRRNSAAHIALDAGPIALVTNPNVPMQVLAATSDARAASAFSLTDGTVITLSAGTRLEAVENTGSNEALVLGPGTAEFRVRPHGPRRWSIDAGLATVDVVGTTFTLRRSDSLLRVEVSEGIVRVRGALVQDGLRRLIAGQSLEVHRAPEPVMVAEHSALAPVPVVPTVPHVADAPVVHHSEWQNFAAQGAFSRAFDNLGAVGVARESARATTPDELFTLADLARYSGHPHDAVAPLERLLREFGSDRRAPVGAFTLGRIEIDLLGNPSAAARAFERAAAPDAPSSIREDARARLAEARFRSGDRAGASTAAAGYLREYPTGRRAEDVRRWLAAPP